MNFELTQEQTKQLNKWKKSLPKSPYVGTIGGAYTYKFIPTGLGLIVTVERIDGYSIDLTNINNW